VYVYDVTRRVVPPTTRDSITGPADVFRILKRRLGRREREHFVVLLLDARNGVLGIETVSVGTVNASLVHPREVFRPAIRENAVALILAHNHPSGAPEPSDDDIKITQRLVTVGETHGIAIVDHIVICRHEYASFRERRLL
jgi:DNA repair protein RadC